MKHFITIFMMTLLIASCSEQSRKQHEFSGGCLTMALEYEPSTIIPRKVTDYYSATILMQVMEGLIGMDQASSKIIPKLATEWTISDDGKKFEFHLRKDVFFHDHEIFDSKDDRLLSPEDILTSVQLACTKDDEGHTPAAYNYVFQYVKGASEFLEGKADHIEGLTINEGKIIFELIHEDQNFLYKLASVNATIGSAKALQQAGLVIGTGPFQYTSPSKTSDDVPQLILTKNQDYYLEDEEGNALPYLDSVKFIFESRKLEQLTLFETGETDFIVGLPTSRITRMLEGRIEDFNSKPPKLILANNPLLETNYYYFNLKQDRFKDPRVRQAFNYALNKESIGREILRNQYYDLGFYGVTPPIGSVLKGYNFSGIKESSYTYNPEKAKALLAEAGYPNGDGFGTVELRYNIDDTHSAVADEFSKQIKRVLGINVNIDGSTFEQLNKDGENGNGDIFRMGWSADYPNPENFLMNFYGKYVPEDENEPSELNKPRYKNPIFDEFFEKATESAKVVDQMEYLSKAEIALMQDPPIIPLWYTGDIQIANSYVRNLKFNAINTFDFSRIYLKEWTDEEYQKVRPADSSNQ